MSIEPVMFSRCVFAFLGNRGQPMSQRHAVGELPVLPGLPAAAVRRGSDGLQQLQQPVQRGVSIYTVSVRGAQLRQAADAVRIVTSCLSCHLVALAP